MQEIKPMSETQQPVIPIAMTLAEWAVVRQGITKLPIEVGIGVLMKFEQQIATAQRPREIETRREGCA